MSQISVIEFDFQARREQTVDWNVAGIQASIANNCHCWIDIDFSDKAALREELHSLGIGEIIFDNVTSLAIDGRHDVYDECLHVSVAAAPPEAGRTEPLIVDLILAHGLFLTLHRGPVPFLQQVRRSYKQDFVKFAQSIGFLLYEFFDHLIDAYRRRLRQLEDQVEQVQSNIFGNVDDTIFSHVATLMHDLLNLRKNILAAREVLHELSTRKSSFVPETTRPYLENMVGTLERLGSDLSVEREILAETLNLYLGIVSHRTNRIISRLTVVSMIFLPLTFLCGVYGMNFETFPEIRWKYGYAVFWMLCTGIVTGLLILIRSKRLL